MLKKSIALLLCVVMVTAVFAGCSTLEKGDKGAIVQMYLDTEIYNFDPTVGFYDDAKVKMLGLVYDGLTTLNEKGKVELLAAKSYKTYEKEGSLYMQITLNDSKWSDGIYVRADDFIFAWKRILDPDYDCEASSLLYDIKNAYAIKQGDASIDSLGARAIDTFVIEIEFERTTADIDHFLELLASPALVPLREDIAKGDNWAKKATSIVANGPFGVKQLIYGNRLVLERNAYYYLDAEKNEALDKYVIPYRIYVDYTKTPEELLDAYKNNQVFYIGNIPLSARAEYKKQAEITDLMSTHTYFFNLENDLFSDARVRQALSMAIDRNEIINRIVFGEAANGLVSNGVFDENRKKSFREVGGEVISTSANVEQAKQLLSEAGVRGGSFTLTIRDDETDRAIAEYVTEVWSSLGFRVNIRALKATSDVVDGTATLYTDHYTDAYLHKDYDVIAIDLQMLSHDAFTVLSPFAKPFSGGGCDLSDPSYPMIPHVTGYDNADYNALMEQIYAETDNAKRTALLHEAERMLMTDMPVIPLVFNQEGSLSSKILSGIKRTYFGTLDLKRMKQKNYMQYKAEDAE